ncbi:MAG: tRNA pseudouridine(38-40) synthase TruA [Nitrospinae bacterium]|nr:tRNA pseudouridine(38-40) synthase TruA [Nitrospinota bacterium]
MRIKLTLSYDGTNYHGWQVQPDGETIQSTLQKAIEKIVGENSIIASGRTDAGVHAEGQVALVEFNQEIPLWNFQNGLNSLLPKDIAVINVEEASEQFHPRFSSTLKHYRYTILNSRVRNVFQQKYCWQIPVVLDVDLMNQGAQFLLGKHDFSAFQSSSCCSKDPVKEIFAAQCIQNEEWIFFHIEGSGFLKQMVRTIVGTLVEVGKKKMKPDFIQELVKSRERKKAGKTAPASGLCLVKVLYSKELKLTC